MSRSAVYLWFLGVAETRGGVAASLYGLPRRPFFWPRSSKSCFRAAERSAPDSCPPLPQPSWATTKETTEWRFGA